MSKLKIYLDNCSYNRPFDDQAQKKIHLETVAKLYIQEDIRAGKHSLVWSYMLDFENGENSYEDKRNAIALWEDIADEYCPSSEEVVVLGEKIMTLGIGEKDSLQLACAITSGCDYFITTDKKLLNKTVSGIKIIDPIKFITETEGN
jgi:predicted nucleic acid-binding protein